MTNSQSDYIRVAVDEDSLSELVSTTEWTRIRQVAALFPGAISEFFGFECDLGSPEPVADYLICLGPQEGGLDVLAGNRPERQISPALVSEDSWARLVGFAKNWADPESDTHDAINGMWLEFDMADVDFATPRPNVFFGSTNVRRGYGVDWLFEAIEKLQGFELDSASRAHITACVERLPDAAHVFQVGLMLARPIHVVRLCVRGIAPAEILGYLEKVGWEGDNQELQGLLDELAPIVDRIDLDLDIGCRTLPKIGLECYVDVRPPKVDILLEYLAERGLCLESKRRPLQRWIGIAHERLVPEWPAELLELSSLLDSRADSTFVRWLHHVKISYQTGGRLQAKAYLAVRHHWMNDAQTRAVIRKAYGVS